MAYPLPYRGATMNPKLFMNPNVFWFLTAIFLVYIPPAEAQQPAKTPKVGFLSAQSASMSAERKYAFQKVMRDLGYVEGQNIVIEYRWGDGNSDRLADLAAELVRLKVNVIVTSGGPSSQEGN
jgi:putative ABC transport system substrate-binding protein